MRAAVLSVLILCVFAVLGLVVLPALAEIRRKDRDEPPDTGEAEDVPLAA